MWDITAEILNITNMKPTSPAEIDLGTFLGMLLLVVVILGLFFFFWFLLFLPHFEIARVTYI